MKKTRKLAALAASILAVACLAAPMSSSISFSADADANTITITSTDNATHTYNVYQIFGGTVTDGKLEGITFAGSDFDAFLAALQSADTIGSDFADCTTIGAVANVLAGYTTDSTSAKAFAKFVATHTDLVKTITPNSVTGPNLTGITDDGYYVIVEGDLTGAEDAAMTRYILAQYDASAGAEIRAKSSYPTVEKKIQEDDKNVAGNPTNGAADGNEKWNDVADYCISEEVPFKLYGTMPNTIDDYTTYKYIFHDTLGSEFTLANDFTTNGVTVKIDGIEVEGGYEVSTSNDDGYTIDITFADIKSCTDTNSNQISITKDTVVTVEYKATLNDTAVIGQKGQTNEVYLEYSNNPNYDGTGTETTSKTPTDKVIAFTYEIDTTKIDSATSKALEGATFALYRETANGDKEYATFNTDADGTITGWTSDADSKSTTSGSSFIFKGLDDGTYYLEEITAPEGYNKLENAIKLVLTATTSNTQNEDADGTEYTNLTLTVDDTTNAESSNTSDTSNTSGKVSLTVSNKSGSTLPSTGGIGTTIFYVAGGILVAGAGVLLVSKKRMANK